MGLTIYLCTEMNTIGHFSCKLTLFLIVYLIAVQLLYVHEGRQPMAVSLWRDRGRVRMVASMYLKHAGRHPCSMMILVGLRHCIVLLLMLMHEQCCIIKCGSTTCRNYNGTCDGGRILVHA